MIDSTSLISDSLANPSRVALSASIKISSGVFGISDSSFDGLVGRFGPSSFVSSSLFVSVGVGSDDAVGVIVVWARENCEMMMIRNMTNINFEK